MSEPDPQIIESSLSSHITRDGITVEVCIYRLEDTEWTLEVVNSNGTSIVWDDLFPSDKAAHDEFERTIAEDGMASFKDDDQTNAFFIKIGSEPTFDRPITQ